MAAKMGAMVLLVAIVAVGTPSVSTAQVTPLNALGNIGGAVTGQTVTLIDIPGLKITSRTQAPDGGINIGALLGAGGPPTISIIDRIEGTWMNPVTFTSTTELPTKLLSSLIPAALGGAGSSPMGIPGTSLAAADDGDDFDVDVPDIDIHHASTTVHASAGGFNFPGFNIPLPKLPFPFGSPAPKSSPPPPSPRHQAAPSPPPPPSPRHQAASSPPPPPSPRHHTASSPPTSPPRHESSPPPPKSHKSSPAESPKRS